MLKQLLLPALTAVSLSAGAENAEPQTPLEPTFRKDAVITSWRNDWFIGVSGGASAFVGNPKGCADLFGRVQPSVGIELGKWITPTVGWRVAAGGLKLTNGDIATQSYYNIHSDIMWNLLGKSADTRWGIVPFAGVGIISNKEAQAHPFALSCGVQGSYRLGKRLRIFMEFDNTTTFRNFDGDGSPNKLGDNLLNLSAGISLTMGRTGAKRIVDATPYIRQNDILMSRSLVLSQRNRELLRQYSANARLVAELTKILDLEGLLEKYRDLFEKNDGEQENQKTEYSGLRSLYDRLGRGGDLPFGSGIAHVNGNRCIGAPIHFFFVIGTSEFTDKSQMINVNEIARVALEYNLSIRVIGAADSATGTDEINATLAGDRAARIATLLTSRGVAPDRITTSSEGGVNTYEPSEANRQVQVELYL
jgi:outer membrane protein OmpA-like peptidoglycan-associated protein